MTNAETRRDVHQALISDHFRRPRNRGALNEAAVMGRADNPACGDIVRVWAGVSDGKIVRATFDGSGCLLSQAAASMVTVLVRGKTLDAVARLRSAFAEGLQPDAEALPAEFGDLRALEGVRRFPNRARCAVLAFDALAEALAVGDDRRGGPIALAAGDDCRGSR